jgi:hypothetical protein
VAGTDFAVDVDSVDALQQRWRQDAGAVAKVEQALARACRRAGEIAFDTAMAKPLAMPLLTEAIQLLEQARSQADQLVAALNADVAKLGQCAANYRHAEEQITAKLRRISRPTRPTRGVGHPGGGFEGSGGSGRSGRSAGSGRSGGSGGSRGSGDQATPPRYANQAQVMAWINQAFKDLEAAGVPSRELDEAGVLTMIHHESSGNPNATNLWDSNARAGHPSKGLMQTIDSTFNAYKLPGHDDIYNPVDNIIAGVRYAISRYGSISAVPGVRAVDRGDPYVGY